MTLAVNLAQGASNNVTFRNKLINGNMVIDQRNAGASVTPASGAYTLDRWSVVTTIASAFSVQQSSTVPTTGSSAFKNSVLLTSLAASSVVAGTVASFQQFIEGNNCYDLGWGTASAQPATFSFWVRSSLTGTFPVQVQNSAQTYTYLATYTISSANTWQYVSFSMPAQTSGVWSTDNSTGIIIRFVLASGSTYQTASPNTWQAGNYWGTSSATNFIATNNATMYITGVQLEAGTTASPFEYRQYGTELALCQRYYAKLSGGGFSNFDAFAVGFAGNSTTVEGVVIYPVSMRATATVSFSNVRTNTAVGSNTAVTSISATYAGTNTANVVFISSGSTMTQGQGATIIANNNSSGYLDLSAEL